MASFATSESASDRWSEIIRPLLVAIALTPLLVPAGAATVVTPAVTLGAIAGGLLCGGILANALDPVSLEGYDEVTVTVVSLGVVFGATVVVWVIVPSLYLPALLQFAVAFLWGSAIVEVGRYMAGAKIGGT